MFIELAFHAIRQEAYPDALRWISAVIELCPGCVEQLDTVLQTTTAVSQLPTALGGLAPSDDAMHGPNGAVFRSLFYSGHMKREKRKDGRDKAAMAASGGRSEEEKREAIKRAIAAATVNFITPGPGHYHTAIGTVQCVAVEARCCEFRPTLYPPQAMAINKCCQVSRMRLCTSLASGVRTLWRHNWPKTPAQTPTTPAVVRVCVL